MTSPPPPRPPEPTATIWVARKPGARPVDVIVGEAEAERAIADLTAALAAIRAGKQAIAGMLAPRGAHPYPQPGEVVDATIYCGAVAPHSRAECGKPDGHEGRHAGRREGWTTDIAWDDEPGDPATDAPPEDNFEEVRELDAATRDDYREAEAPEVCGLPTWGDEQRPCPLFAGHEPMPGCPGDGERVSLRIAGGAA